MASVAVGWLGFDAGEDMIRCRLKWGNSEFFEERGEALPREDGDVFAVLGSVAAIDEPGAGGFAGLEFRPPEVEAFEGIEWNGLAGFRLDGMQDVAALDDGVDFMAFLVAEEADGGHATGMSRRFGEFGHQPVFENGQRLSNETRPASD